MVVEGKEAMGDVLANRPLKLIQFRAPSAVASAGTTSSRPRRSCSPNAASESTYGFQSVFPTKQLSIRPMHVEHCSHKVA